jgi:hypothetical protein
MPRLWAFLAIVLPALGTLLTPMPSVDLTYHLRAGAEMLAGGGLPTADTWTFTALGASWTDQQWGAQVILGAVYQLGSWTGLALFRAVLTGLIFGCLYLIGRRRGLIARDAALLSLVAFGVSAATLSLRPQYLGMALFAVVLLLVTDRRVHPRGIWLVPLIVLVWANIHGSFFLGPLVLGLAWLEDLHDRVPRPHRALAAALASVVAACVTPFGPSVWVYAFGLSTNKLVTERITEWQPTSLHDLPGMVFFASVVAVVALIARRGARTSWPTLAWLAVFFAIGVYAIRGIAWWPLGAVAAIAGVLVTSRVPDASRPVALGTPAMRRLNVVVAAVLLMAGVALLPVWRPVQPETGAPKGAVSYAPPGITAALRGLAHPGDHVFNPQRWGSWFEFALPEVLVTVDSRIELFPTDVWDAYQGVVDGVDGWQDQLEAWDVHAVVVLETDEALARRLVTAGWRTAYQDEDGSIFIQPGG